MYDKGFVFEIVKHFLTHHYVEDIGHGKMFIVLDLSFYLHSRACIKRIDVIAFNR